MVSVSVSVYLVHPQFFESEPQAPPPPNCEDDGYAARGRPAHASTFCMRPFVFT